MYKILVVDDDSTSLAICKALLEDSYEVLYAESSVVAIGHLKRGEHPDAILLDMVMPGTSGMDLLKIVQENADWKDIPVLFLSSMDNWQFEVEGFQNGAVDILKKPVQPELLTMKLARQIYISQLKKENALLKAEIAELKAK